jgi:hypothetical protein
MIWGKEGGGRIETWLIDCPVSNKFEAMKVVMNNGAKQPWSRATRFKVLTTPVPGMILKTFPYQT